MTLKQYVAERISRSETGHVSIVPEQCNPLKRFLHWLFGD